MIRLSVNEYCLTAATKPKNQSKDNDKDFSRDHQNKRHRQALFDHLQNRLMRERGHSQISLHSQSQPFHISDRKGLIQSEFMFERQAVCRGHVWICGVVRHRIGGLEREYKAHAGNDKQCEAGLQNTTNKVRPHKLFLSIKNLSQYSKGGSSDDFSRYYKTLKSLLLMLFRNFTNRPARSNKPCRSIQSSRIY